MQNIFVKPRVGGRIRMPERMSAVMPEAGAWVPRIDYYERLLICGDLTICEPPAPPTAKKKTSDGKEAPQGGPT
jgi:hypothetical protein